MFAGHVTMELLIDDLQLLRGESSRVFVCGPQRAVVEQLLAENVRADQREISPLYAKGPCQFPVQRPQSAFSRSRRAFGVDDDGFVLARQSSVLFSFDAFVQ